MTGRPHILFVANEVLGWGTYSRQLAAVLAARDDLRVSTLRWRPGRWSTALLRRHNLGGLARVWRRVDPIAAYRGPLGAAIRREVARLGPDLVHFASHWPAAALAWQPGTPPFTAALDCTRGNIDTLKARAVWSRRQRAREAELLRRAARVFPMSRWAAGSLTGDCGVPASRVEVLPPSLDLSRLRPPRSHDGLPNIVFVGNDFARKGGARLCRWVEGPLAGTCHLHIASADPAARVQGRHITAHGRLDHGELLGRLLPEMDILCLPTALDMSPHVLAEAAAAGLPAVASDLGGIPELVIDGETGLLAPPGDDGAFVAALRRLIGDPGLRRRMSGAALRHAAAGLDAKANFDRLADALSGLAGACGSTGALPDPQGREVPV